MVGADAGVLHAQRAAVPTPASAAPSPALVDSIAQLLTLAPVGENVFLVASRGNRLLVDLGRVDIEVRRDSLRARAYRAAVEHRSPVKAGVRLRLRAPWGEEDVFTDSVDSWNGRVVRRLRGSSTLDSAARAKQSVAAVAILGVPAAPPRADSCDRRAPSKGTPLAARGAAVRDSLAQELRNGSQPIYPRLQRKMSLVSSQVAGCFGGARLAVLVSLRASGNEWVREKLALVDTLGRVTALRINDLRFRGHELLHAVDLDGDGVDDLATRAVTERAGATTLLRLDLKAKRLTRFAAGFAWENQ